MPTEKEPNGKIPQEWAPYITQYPQALEIVPCELKAVEYYYSRETYRLEFFGRTLTSPESMLVEHILINGISSNLMYGDVSFSINRKIYFQSSAWRFSLRAKGLQLFPKLMIAPLSPFAVRMNWLQAQEMRGLDNQPVARKPIEVLLIGHMFRERGN